MARLEISLLGPFRVNLAQKPTAPFKAATAEALLAYLVMHTGVPLRREWLAMLLWPDRPPATARHNLRQALNRLRHAIADHSADFPFLSITRQTIQFNRDSEHCLDVAMFSKLIAKTKQHRHRHLELCDGCARRLQQAAELYRGPLLEGFSLNNILFDEWILVERERLHRRALAMLYRLTDYYQACQEYDQAESCARRQLALEPWREEAHQQLMHILALSGQRSAALAQYETCRRILTHELAVEPAETTTELYRKIKTSRISTKGPPRRLQQHNLPSSTTPFIGREQELSDITERLLDPAYRLITLFGAGGVGKTRLALAAAEQVVGAFPHGAWLVPLAERAEYARNDHSKPRQSAALVEPYTAQRTLTAQSMLTAAIADALEIVFSSSGEPGKQLLDHLWFREILLLLDGLEHVPAGAGVFILNLLRNAPQVTVLVTSRERLNLQSEYPIRVEGLPTPETTDDPHAASYSSVQLFKERARRHSAGQPALDESDLPDIVQVCQMVEGLPLAIELAATWLGRLRCAEIAQAIPGNLDFFATSMGDIPERHRSIRTVLENSWCSLSETEQRILTQVSVFSCQFPQEAAQAVSEATPADLYALVSKSLLRQRAPTRYEMPRLLRWFVFDKLVGRDIPPGKEPCFPAQLPAEATEPLAGL